LGLSYRGKMDYRTVVDVDSQISLLASPSDLIFTSTNSLFYDPDTIMAGWSLIDGANSYAVAAKLQLWAGYDGGVDRMVFKTFTGSFNSSLPDVNFQNVISLHAGLEHKFSRARLRGGYAFVPTPVPDQSGELNMLDSDKHEIYLGWGWSWNKWFLDGALKLDLVVFYDYLVPKTVTKVLTTNLGAPGYQIGGSMYGYGATLTREL
jgi:long-subunit fatty acid transport protein